MWIDFRHLCASHRPGVGTITLRTVRYAAAYAEKCVHATYEPQPAARVCKKQSKWEVDTAGHLQVLFPGYLHNKFLRRFLPNDSQSRRRRYLPQLDSHRRNTLSLVSAVQWMVKRRGNSIMFRNLVHTCSKIELNSTYSSRPSVQAFFLINATASERVTRS